MMKIIKRLLAYMESALNKVLRPVNLDKYTYNYHIKKNSKEYNQNKVLMNDSWKSVKQMEDEMRSMRNYWHYPPEYQYIRYKLYEKDLDKEELLDYIPPFYIYRRYNPRIYKNVDKRLFSDKLYLFNFFTKLGVKTPEVLLKVSGGGVLFNIW